MAAALSNPLYRAATANISMGSVTLFMAGAFALMSFSMTVCVSFSTAAFSCDCRSRHDVWFSGASLGVFSWVLYSIDLCVVWCGVVCCCISFLVFLFRPPIWSFLLCLRCSWESIKTAPIVLFVSCKLLVGGGGLFLFVCCSYRSRLSLFLFPDRYPCVYVCVQDSRWFWFTFICVEWILIHPSFECIYYWLCSFLIPFFAVFEIVFFIFVTCCVWLRCVFV